MIKATSGLDISQIFRKIIRKTFVSTVFIAVISDIAGSLISLISSEENDTETVNLSPALYIGLFFTAAVLATAESYEKEKFNGPVIEGYDSDSDSDEEENKDEGKTPRKEKNKETKQAVVRKEFKNDRMTVFKSHLLEGSFLTFSGILVAGDDFFTYSAIKSWFKGLIYTNDINSLVSINWYEILLLSALVLSLDFPYEASNEIRAVSKYIKKIDIRKRRELTDRPDA